MRDHPIQPVSEPYQYRAIGIVRGVYSPFESNQITRGKLIDLNGQEIEAVVLGKALSLLKRHIDLDKPHLWVVYPRLRDHSFLHLQIAGVWEPSTLNSETSDKNNLTLDSFDQIQEGDDYFSIRGDLIYTKPQSKELVIKIRQKARSEKKKSASFKLCLKGQIPFEYLRHFVSLSVRRKNQELSIEEFEIIGPLISKTGKKLKNPY
tara:strand:- start:308 stop:925 length:618 start_codon:yes stop_codon:yes gene_type:complete